MTLRTLLLSALAMPAFSADPVVMGVPVAAGIHQPTGVFFAPGDDHRMYITEQWTGKILVVKDGVLQDTPFLTIPALAGHDDGNEVGLLSVCFDPDYATNGFVYVDYNPPPVTSGRDTFFTVEVMRFHRSGKDPEILDPASGVPVISVRKQAQNHNGSFLAFNPRDLNDPAKRHHLYVSFGDGGNGGDGGPGHCAIGNGQSTRVLLGKIVRIDVDPAAHPQGGYSIPDDNPTLPVSTEDGLSGPALREIWVMGVRNPWRASFDTATGDLYIGDVGDNQREEVDILPYGHQAGANLGWAIREGDGPGTRPNVVPVVTPLREPAYSYPRGSVIGGYVYHGKDIPALVGRYVFADYGGSGSMGWLTPDPANNTVSDVFTRAKAEIEDNVGHGMNGNVDSWGQDNAGELYFCVHNGAPNATTAVYRLRAADGGLPPSFTNTPSGEATVGDAYSTQITVVGKPAPTLTLDKAPKGMALDGNRLTWAAPEIGQWPVTIRASNGQIPDAILTFTVAVAGQQPADNVAESDLETGLWLSRYKGDFNALPDFDGLTALDAVPASSITLDGLRPPGEDANYALRFTGFITIPAAGAYRFFLSSDDGSRLRIGPRVVVDNDGQHGMGAKDGAITLDAGEHAIDVGYFQSGGGSGLSLEWSGPDGVRAPVPATALRRRTNPPGIEAGPRIGAYLNGAMPSTILGKIPATLSATNAFRDTKNHVPAAGVVPYDVTVPLWSDAASKNRWIAVPAGTKATFVAAGNWTFPPGTVLVKDFSYPGKSVETRLLVITPTGAYGVSYRWREDGSDADLVDAGGADATIASTDGAKPWQFPSQVACMQCHTPVSGYVLGVRTEQLNRQVTYPASGRTADQLDTLNTIGFIKGYDRAKAKTYPTLASMADTTQPLERRARSYLEVNCAMCHQPGGPAPVRIDLRYVAADSAGKAMTPTLASLQTAPQHDLGITGAQIICPGSPERSMIIQRMSSTNKTVMMPPLARQTVDADAEALLTQWIAGLKQ
jgi:uncharacterized repeat protein (TIGR03806 family)